MFGMRNATALLPNTLKMSSYNSARSGTVVWATMETKVCDGVEVRIARSSDTKPLKRESEYTKRMLARSSGREYVVTNLLMRLAAGKRMDTLSHASTG